MAHIPDGIVSVPVLVAGAVVSLGGLGMGLRRLTPERVPKVAVLAALFFVASLVHFPVGLTSVHLLLGGLAGVILGWAAFPAIAVGLILQAVLFGFGGLIVLGVNIANIALPAVLMGLLGRRFLARPTLAGIIAGGGAVAATALMVAVCLALSGREFLVGAKLLVFTYVPLMAVEAVFTAAVLGLLVKVKPEALEMSS
ncbi:cobalt transporter CbiM [Magnetospirillum sulfuroxidans]|uniref:Cobalt transporter CbiM n=1 Tax=Magnetospirillum sulfuroxidans TaxID=611300 RepID=A0ABS5IFF3_9PROT|nr:cobalt transporter CbiM [Magnetospirillum sulfuroxidans]MBR9973151.1 cobalt transporter CbiM [Magnetospirillum sulfuroxidans]